MSTQQQPSTVNPWTLGWRLRWAIEHARLDVQEAAKKIEVSRTTLSRWAHDDIVPKQIFLLALADLCGVNRDWLVTGRGLPLGEAPEPPGPRGGGRIVNLINSAGDDQDDCTVNCVPLRAA